MNRKIVMVVCTSLSVLAAAGVHSLGAADYSMRKGATTQAIHHLGIATGNLDRSLKFYRDLMGMEMKNNGRFEGEIYDRIFAVEGARGRIASLALGNVVLELMQFEHPRGKEGDSIRPAWDHGINHISFLVEDVHQDYERLRAAGVRFHCPPQTKGGAKATYGRDPDGNIFELLQLSAVSR